MRLVVVMEQDTTENIPERNKLIEALRRRLDVMRVDESMARSGLLVVDAGSRVDVAEMEKMEGIVVISMAGTKQIKTSGMMRVLGLSNQEIGLLCW